MNRVISVCEKNVVLIPFNPVKIGVGSAVVVFKALTDIMFRGEVSGRYIQNVGANPCYYAIGHDCDPTNFNGILFAASAVDANGYGPGQQLDVSNVGQSISIYSVAGTTVALTVLKRNDNEAGSGGILNQSK